MSAHADTEPTIRRLASWLPGSTTPMWNHWGNSVDLSSKTAQTPEYVYRAKIHASLLTACRGA